MRLTDTDRPLANTMWDYSWIERRYPGGGYADWPAVLDELSDRGYDLVRIDAFPHMIATDFDREWVIKDGKNPSFPWGAPSRCRVRPGPALVEFVELCRDRDLLVGLTTWFEEARRYPETLIETPQDWGSVWIETLSHLEEAGLLDPIAFVDLHNEFGGEEHPWIDGDGPGPRHTASAARWMNGSIDAVRGSYPDLDYTISFSSGWETWDRQDVSALDFLELHLFMDAGGGQFCDFIDLLGHPRPWGFDYLDALAGKGEQLYRLNPGHWKEAVRDAVAFGIEWSETVGKPIVTTEAWGPPRAMDWPGFDWGWFKELDAAGVHEAIDSSRFLSVCTSNHCGPQFRGMWEDVEWHRDLTDAIHAGELEMD